MKEVRFKLEKQVIIEYRRDQLRDDLRNKISQYLIKYYLRKIEAGEIENHSQLIKYISLIFEKALGPKLLQSELKKIESNMIKFNFLSHSGSGADNLIHEVAYILVGLCSGNKELVQRYSSPWRILYSDLNEEKSLDWDHSRALCQDVANLTRECVKDFLYEIKNFGKIMTSAELEEHNNALTAPTAEEDNYSDDEFETYSDDDKLSSTDTSKNNQETQQNDASLSIENDITEEENSNSSEIKADYDSKPNLVLEFILSWINELPQWLQDKILDSSPIKSLVESIEQTSAMYDKKSVSDIFTISQSFEASDSLQNEVEDNRQEKVKLCDLPSEGAIDMTMIWKEPTVNGWILPMVGIESGNMFEDDAAFNGLNNFYGHGFIVF